MKRKIEYKATDQRWGFTIPELRNILQNLDDRADLKVTGTKGLTGRPTKITIETEVEQ